MKVAIVPIVIDAFGTVTKGLLTDLEDLGAGGRVETIQTTALLKRPEYWEESWRLEETHCRSNSSEKPSANADVKNSRGVNNNNNNNTNNNNICSFVLQMLYHSWNDFKQTLRDCWSHRGKHFKR